MVNKKLCLNGFETPSPLLDVKENDQVLLVKEIQDEKVLFITNKRIKLLSKDL
jgi:hypothetical protein